jgi:hypothetical protein
MITRGLLSALLALAAGCTDASSPIEIELGDESAMVANHFTLDGHRELRVRTAAPLIVEAWLDGGAFDEVPAEQLAAGASPSWWVPQPITGERVLSVAGAGNATLTVWARGRPPPPAVRDRALAWFDAALLDDPSIVSFAGTMAAIADDGHGGALLARWFTAFAAGPGAGRAAFAQFLGELRTQQGSDPAAWNLAALPFRVTGVHNRHDLARGVDCGELRVSVASTHPTFSPVHLLFIFRQPPGDDDAAPDGMVHCRGSARRWARLAELDAAGFRAAARDIIATGVTRERFLLAESVELSISPWQWRQWLPDLTNPLLFQTVDIDRLNAPGPARDRGLALIAAGAAQIAARAWPVPDELRAPVAEVAPNARAPLVDLSPLPDVLARFPQLPRALGMIGCPRCHTDDTDFVQTSVDRRPSPFYDRELDARAARLDALDAGGFPAVPPFGPLQPL